MAFEVMIASRGYLSPRMVEAIDVSSSWDLRGGSLSAIFHRQVIADLPWSDISRKWVLYDSPVGLWGGVVETIPNTFHTRTVELACVPFRQLFEDRRCGSKRLSGRPPGCLAIRMFRDTDNEVFTGVDEFRADRGGRPMPFEAREESLAAALDAIADQSDFEWRVAVVPDSLVLLAEFRQRLGSDKSGWLYLHEHPAMLEGEHTTTTRGMTNDLLGIAADTQYELTERHVALDPRSIHQYGRLQKSRRYEGIVIESVMRPVIEAEVLRRRSLLSATRATVPLSHPYAPLIEEGDWITLVMPSANAQKRCRVLSRALRGRESLELSLTAQDFDEEL